eukprot:scaffold16568_cov119-Isochrysis_galbana.AAC.3
MVRGQTALPEGYPVVRRDSMRGYGALGAASRSPAGRPSAPPAVPPWSTAAAQAAMPFPPAPSAAGPPAASCRAL